MKMLASVILGLCVASAFGQFQNPARIINRQKVDIAPLFSWWTNAETIVRLNDLRPSKKDRKELPPRPLAAWVRVSGVCSNGNQHGWILHARINPQPGSNYSDVIFLRNPPEARRRQLEAAAARLERVEGQLGNAQDRERYSSAVSSAHSDRGQLFDEIGNAAPGNNTGFRNAADAHYARANEASRRARAADREAEALSREKQSLLETTKGWKTFLFDDFALRTTETYKGLPVFDVGAR